MIELNTGVPGSGKTLSMVQQLASLVGRWERHPEEARPIFVHGIPELSLPHAAMPLLSVSVGQLGLSEVIPDWQAMPHGSLVIIDECQCAFPPRSTQSKPLPHVAWLNVHRHNGFDIWLTTQHPKLMDGSVRALVGKHKHFRRLFGGQRAMVYEFDACNDGLGGLKNAVKSYWAYPKKAYTWYKSAEVHTKQRFRLPLWVFIPVLAVALGAVFVPRAYSALTRSISGKGLHDSASSAATPVIAAPVLDTRTFSTTVTARGYFNHGGAITLLLSDGRVIFQPQQFKVFPGGYEAQIAPDLWVRGGVQ